MHLLPSHKISYKPQSRILLSFNFPLTYLLLSIIFIFASQLVSYVEIFLNDKAKTRLNTRQKKARSSYYPYIIIFSSVKIKTKHCVIFANISLLFFSICIFNPAYITNFTSKKIKINT